MGFFSTNQQDKSTNTVKQLAQNANETSNEIDAILSRFLKNQEKFDALSDELLVLAKRLRKNFLKARMKNSFLLLKQFTIYRKNI
tara:strand:- start:245 stop:499 length:255 start_codon:yes stop_codon:yes gene_type:complete